MSVLAIKDLHKSFGTSKIIDGLTLDVPRGSIFGFLGQNGAGKTTTMKMILGLLAPESGAITIQDEPVTFGQTATNRFVGYLPDVPQFYPFVKPLEYLALCGEVTAMPREIINARSLELLAQVGLEGVNKRIGAFSRGMKQRLGIAQALLNRPSLLICDEPTSALDPVGRKEILEILSDARGDATVIFSTHILSDVERICDYAAVLHKGKIAMSGELHELKAAHQSDCISIEFFTEGEALFFLSLSNEILGSPHISGTTIEIRTHDISATQNTLLALLRTHKVSFRKIEIVEPTIESLFLEATK